MAVIKSLVLALSTYSKIPMPTINYKENDGRFSLCFFPVVGLVIAFFEYLWFLVCWYLHLTGAVCAAGYLVIPVIITGGIHIDGFMDCMDAIHSYGDKDKKLEILKDPHIGAFCVIKLLELTGILFICLIITDDFLFKLVCVGFVVSRILSAISIATFKQAKDTGMVAYTRSHSSKACVYVLVLELIAVCAYAIFEYRLIALWPIAAAALCFAYYNYKSKKDFGGITGDTAGCFLVMTEAAWIITLFIFSVVESI